MAKREEIQSFFDRMSVNRDQSFARSPLLYYDQQMRQEAVIELLDATKGETILDVGAGNLRDSILFSNSALKVYSLDISAKMLLEGIRAISGGNAPHCVQGSALNLPFPDGAFDKISCSEVIEHIPDYQLVFREFHRCTKPGGVLVITTPNWHSLYGLNRKVIEFVQKIFRKKAWGTHPLDEWKTLDELEKVIGRSDYQVEKKLGICYLPGFSFGRFSPKFLQKLIVKIVAWIEVRIRSVATKWGYGIGIRARKVS